MILAEYAEILDLLERERSLCLRFEQAGQEMSTQEVEQIEENMKFCEELLSKLKQIRKKIRALCDEKYPDLLPVLNVQCDASSLSEGEKKVLDASLRVHAVLNRINGQEVLVREHLEFVREKIKGQIEKLNQSSVSVAEKYRKSVSTGLTRPYLPNEGSKI